MLTTLAAVATILFIFAGGLVGVRLLARAWRNGGFAEWTLGGAMLLICGLGYPLALAAGDGAGGAEIHRPLAIGGNVLVSTGWCLLWLFTWRTFRADATWAGGLAPAAIAASVGLMLWRTWRLLTVGEVAALMEPTLDAIGVQYLALAVYVWTAVEGFRYHALLRKRLALGLADPVVTNRFLLWALLGVFSFLSLIGPVWGAVVGVGAEQLWLVRLPTAIAGLACAVLLQLAFMPPAAYLRRLRA